MPQSSHPPSLSWERFRSWQQAHSLSEIYSSRLQICWPQCGWALRCWSLPGDGNGPKPEIYPEPDIQWSSTSNQLFHSDRQFFEFKKIINLWDSGPNCVVAFLFAWFMGNFTGWSWNYGSKMDKMTPDFFYRHIMCARVADLWMTAVCKEGQIQSHLQHCVYTLDKPDEGQIHLPLST